MLLVPKFATLQQNRERESVYFYIYIYIYIHLYIYMYVYVRVCIYVTCLTPPPKIHPTPRRGGPQAADGSSSEGRGMSVLRIGVWGLGFRWADSLRQRLQVHELVLFRELLRFHYVEPESLGSQVSIYFSWCCGATNPMEKLYPDEFAAQTTPTASRPPVQIGKLSGELALFTAQKCKYAPYRVISANTTCAQTRMSVFQNQSVFYKVTHVSKRPPWMRKGPSLAGKC